MASLRQEIRRRGDALLERVGLAEAADRRVGTYSGGMKRRLDLALALVHQPRILFLDEPTTGLDIQSRAALWDEVAHLAREEGVTVFLTTQYLEEADQLADRVGIIDHGRLVAEGTPAALKAEIGRPTVEATPHDRADAERLQAALRRFGEEMPAAPGGVAVRLTDGVEELTEIVRALDAEGIRIANLEIHAPSLDDVFLTKTGRSARGRAATTRKPTSRLPASSSRRPPRYSTCPQRRRQPRFRRQARYMAWRAVIRTARQPIVIVPPLVFPLFLLAINASGLDAATQIPGFPADSYLAFVLAFPFMQGAIFATNTAGTNIAQDIGSGFFNRLSLTPMRGSSLLAGQLTGVLLVGTIQAIAFLAAGLAAGAHIAAGPLGVLVIFALSLSISAAFGTIGLLVGLRTGSGEAVQGLFPLMFILLFLSSAALPRDLIAQDWFQTVATINPVSYLIEGIRSLVITGWDAEALALAFGIAIAIFAVGLAASTAALRERLVRT